MRLHKGIFLEVTEEELQFIFEVIKTVEIDETSSELVKDLDTKLKEVIKEYIVCCDGCNSKDVEIRRCPVSDEEVPLCEKCFKQRRSYKEK